MPSIIDDLRYFGPSKRVWPKQTIPTHEELIASGAEETGYTILDYTHEPLQEGRDTRSYAVESPQGQANLLYVPDAEGFYVENFNGNQWRPEDLAQLHYLLEEMDHQLSRYGELL